MPDEARFARIEKDLWYGNGKPGLTTRVEKNEDAVATLKHDLRNARQDTLDDCLNINKRIDNMEANTNKRIDSTDKKFTAIIILLLTLMGGLALDLVKSYSQPTQHSSMY